MFVAHCEYGYPSGSGDVVLGSIDREFEAPSFVSLKGVNGSGKSTLLETMGGRLAPLSGQVTIDGADVASKAAAGRVHSVSAPVFIPDLTVGEHIDLVMKNAEAHVAETLEVWRVNELRKFAPRMLSSGQLQRLFLALSFINPSEVMLLDEPERHLDQEWTRFLADELSLLAHSGRVVIVASHDDVIHSRADEVLGIG